MGTTPLDESGDGSTGDPMTTATAAMFMRQRDEALAEVETLRAKLREAAEFAGNVIRYSGWDEDANLLMEQAWMVVRSVKESATDV